MATIISDFPVQARGDELYVPAWPGLAVEHLIQHSSREVLPFPLNAENQSYFYRARNAIYHLICALHWQPGATVLMPDYHSGNEVAAVRVAGANVRFFPINRSLQPDLDVIEKLIRQRQTRALLTVHYLGWPQPVEQLARLCREHGVLLIEDCALALLSGTQDQALGSFGDYAIFCLYKTLPVPNGGLLVQNNLHTLPDMAHLRLKTGGLVSVGGRMVDLFLEHYRSHHGRTGKLFGGIKSAIGRSMTALGVNRVPVGDMGFDLTQVDVAMSAFCRNLLSRFDYQAIREKRRRNFLMLRERLTGRVTLLKDGIEDDVCPLFFPILVKNKHETACALWRRQISVVEFWNFGDPEVGCKPDSDTAFLRRHVLELPLHQDITPKQIDYMARELLNLPESTFDIAVNQVYKQ